MKNGRSRVSIFLFNYGTEKFCIRIGFTGCRPLVYAIYMYNESDELPFVQGQTYRNITKDQFEWVRNHLTCDVSFVSGEYPDRIGNLECRTHGAHYHLFDLSPVHADLWEDRQV
jgi:hypothetical protein